MLSPKISKQNYKKEKDLEGVNQKFQLPLLWVLKRLCFCLGFEPAYESKTRWRNKKRKEAITGKL